jgi:mono/diheme cytochrome c family protein
MRLPVAGTVARGHLPYPFQDAEEAASLRNPLPRTQAVLQRGRKVYENHCAVCHGVLGDGAGTLTAAYGAKPANLQSETFREQYPDGKIYHSIVAGKNSMPSYAADIPEDDRWAVVHYVRVLQRAQNAEDSDVEEALKR